MIFNYLNTPQLWKEAEAFLYTQPRLAIDKESSVKEEWRSKNVSALNIHCSQIEIVSIKGDEGYPYVLDFKVLKEVYNFYPDLVSLFQSRDYLLGANLKFDLQLFFQEYGMWLENCRDIILMGRMISNATGSKFGAMHGHSLSDLCRDWLNIHLEGKGEKLQSSDWAIPLPKRTLENEYWRDKLTYAAKDTEYLFLIHDQMLPTIINPLPHSPLIEEGTRGEDFGLGMKKAFELEMDVIPVIARMEYEGIPTSPSLLKEVKKSIKRRLNQVALDLAKFFNLPLDKSENIFSSEEFASKSALKTLNQPSALLTLIRDNLSLYNLDNTQTSVLERTLDIIDKVYSERFSTDQSKEGKAESVQVVTEAEEELYKQLEMLEESFIVQTIPIIHKIVEYRRLKKLEGMDLRKFINPATQRIHSSIFQIGTATSRLSCIAEGQRVMVPGGYKPIEEVEIGDYVYCYKDDGKPSVSKVLNTFYNGMKDVVKVKWQNYKKDKEGSLVCTPDHKIRTKQKGWVRADELSKDDIIYHLHRTNSKGRPYLSGIGYFREREQTLIKKEFFKVNSSNFHIHHKDHNPSNNSLENLEILTKSEHHSHHNKGVFRGKFYPKCSIKRKLLDENSNWIDLSKFSLLRMISEARGRPTYVPMDFETFKRKCRLAGINLEVCKKRYGSHGIYLSKANIRKAINLSKNTEEASKKLGIGTRRLKELCQELGIEYNNHKVIEVELLKKPMPVYNLEIKEYHNFITEECDVSNCRGPNVQQIAARTKLEIPIEVEEDGTIVR